MKCIAENKPICSGQAFVKSDPELSMCHHLVSAFSERAGVGLISRDACPERVSKKVDAGLDIGTH
jgi:hypothetical protein